MNYFPNFSQVRFNEISRMNKHLMESEIEQELNALAETFKKMKPQMQGQLNNRVLKHLKKSFKLEEGLYLDAIFLDVSPIRAINWFRMEYKLPFKFDLEFLNILSFLVYSKKFSYSYPELLI